MRIEDLEYDDAIKCDSEEEVTQLNDLLLEKGFKHRNHHNWLTLRDFYRTHVLKPKEGWFHNYPLQTKGVVYPASDFLGGDSIMNEFLETP
jgi:hypothetical protein